MSECWTAEAQNIAYGLLVDGVIKLRDNADKFQLLRSVASWSERDCMRFVIAYPEKQQERLWAELPGPSEPEDPRTFWQKVQKAKSSNHPGTGREPYNLSDTPKLVIPAYLHDVLTEQPGQKRKRISIDDTAAVYVSSAPASAVSVDRIMMQAQWEARRRFKYDPSGKGKGKMSDLYEEALPPAWNGGWRNRFGTGFGKGRTCSSREFAGYVSDRYHDDAEVEVLKQESKVARLARSVLF